MSRAAKYNVKAQNYVVPARRMGTPATDWQMNTISALSRRAGLADDARLLEWLDKPHTFEGADKMIKRLAEIWAGAKPVEAKPANSKPAAQKPLYEKPVRKDKTQAAAAIREIAKQHGIKLGKVAEKHLAAC